MKNIEKYNKKLYERIRLCKIFNYIGKYYKRMSKFNSTPVPHYFKSDFPDQRFLPFRLYLHKKCAKDKLPDITYFESFYQSKPKSKKRRTKLTSIRSNRIFENKERLYCELFTNGNVNIRSEYSPFTTKTPEQSPIPFKSQEKLNIFIEKARSKSQKKPPIQLLIDKEKKQVLIRDRKIKKIITKKIP